MILINSIVLALFDYTDRTSQTFHNQVLDKINFIFTMIYAIEALLKIIAYGFYKSRTAYLKEPWNILDFIVSIIG
jgi:Na+/melibiose symporter-like transporter